MPPVRKTVRTEIDAVLYDFVVRTAREKRMTLKEATREALRLWVAQEGDLSRDPLFEPEGGEEAPKGTDASKVDAVVYRRRRR